jgi:hypothetical protein
LNVLQPGGKGFCVFLSQQFDERLGLRQSRRQWHREGAHLWSSWVCSLVSSSGRESVNQMMRRTGNTFSEAVIATRRNVSIGFKRCLDAEER